VRDICEGGLYFESSLGRREDLEEALMGGRAEDICFRDSRADELGLEGDDLLDLLEWEREWVWDWLYVV